MKILIAGCAGQLGRSLAAALGGHTVEAAARDRLSVELDFEEAARQHKRVEKIQETLKLRDELEGKADELTAQLQRLVDQMAELVCREQAGVDYPRERFDARGAAAARAASALEPRVHHARAQVEPPAAEGEEVVDVAEPHLLPRDEQRRGRVEREERPFGAREPEGRGGGHLGRAGARRQRRHHPRLSIAENLRRSYVECLRRAENPRRSSTIRECAP